MVFEFAWYRRCARIIWVNSCAMSTLDCSSAEPINVPRPPVPGLPTLAMPADWLSPYLFEPSFTRPFGLLKFAIASWPTEIVWPAPNVATIEPSELMLMLSTLAAAEPFWLLEEVAEAEAKPVRDAVPAASTRSHRH